MARTQAADYEEKREAIVERSADLFAVRGFLGTSVADIAKACDTSKSLLYHYYPSKEDVLYAVMLSHIDKLIEDLEVVQTMKAAPRDILKKLLRLFMQHYVGASSRQKVLLNDLENLPDDKRKGIVEKQRIIVDTVQTLLTRCLPELSKDRSHARAKTMLLFGAINWTGHWFNPAGAVNADMIADMALEMAVGDATD